MSGPEPLDELLSQILRELPIICKSYRTISRPAMGYMSASNHLHRPLLCRWTARAFLLLLCTLPAAADAADPERSAEHYEQALLYFDRQNYRAAIIELQNALQQDPGNFPAHLLAGRAYLKVGEGVAAENALTSAREQGADEQLIVVPLGRAYLAQQKFQEVLAEICSSCGGVNAAAELLTIRGHAHLGLHELDQAERSFTDASTLDRRYGEPVVGLARVAITRGDRRKASSLSRKSTRIDPENPDAWHLAGEISRLGGEFERALTQYGKAIEIKAEHWEARLSRAATLIDLGREDEASDDVEALLEQNPELPHAVYLKALILARSGDLEGAREVLQAAAAMLGRLDPEGLRNSPAGLIAAGTVSFATGQYEQARAYLERYLELSPHHRGARKLLATVYLNQGQPESSIRILEPAMTPAPADPGMYVVLGSAYMQAAEYRKASEALEKAMALAPEQMAVRTQLALSRFAGGDRKTAISDLESALALDVEGSRAALVLGLLHLKTGDFARALDVAREIRAREPENPAAYKLAGDAMLAQGDLAGARTSYRQALEADAAYAPAQYSLAELDIREGHIGKARRRYKTILREKPEDLQAMMGMATADQRDNRVDDAIPWLEKVRAKYPHAIDAQVRLIRIHMDRGDHRTALEIARTLEAWHPHNAQALEALGRVELELDQKKEAGVTLRRILELKAVPAPTLHRAATLLLEAGDLEQARSALYRALREDPNYLPAAAAFVALDLRIGNYRAAASRAARLQELHPDSPLAHAAMGDVLMRMHRFDEAADAYTLGFEKKRSSHLAVQLFYARWKAGRRDDAIGNLERWVGEHPDDPLAGQTLASAYFESGRPDAARPILETLVRERPDDPDLLNSMAWLYQELGDNRAETFAKRAYLLAPKKAATLDTYGWVLVQNGKAEQGLGYLRKARALSSKDPRIQYHIAVALSRTGRTGEARRHLESLLSAGRDAEVAQDARALLQELDGN